MGNKIEEKLMASFIKGRGNLDFFTRRIGGIAEEIGRVSL